MLGPEAFQRAFSSRTNASVSEKSSALDCAPDVTWSAMIRGRQYALLSFAVTVGQSACVLQRFSKYKNLRTIMLAKLLMTPSYQQTGINILQYTANWQLN